MRERGVKEWRRERREKELAGKERENEREERRENGVRGEERDGTRERVMKGKLPMNKGEKGRERRKKKWDKKISGMGQR